MPDHPDGWMVVGMRARTDPGKLALLRRIPALRSAPEAVLVAVAAAVDVVDVAAGQRLTVEGHPRRSIHLVVEGSAVAERGGVVVAAIGAGDVVADLVPAGGDPRGATVRATTPMRLLVAGPAAVADLLDGLAAAAEAAVGAAAAPAPSPRPDRLGPAVGSSVAPA